MNLFTCEINKNVAFTQPPEGTGPTICTSIFKELHNIWNYNCQFFKYKYLEQYIMTPNYPDDYPHYYEEVILKFPCFPHDAQYSRHGHWSQQPGNQSLSHSQHSILSLVGTQLRLLLAPPPRRSPAPPYLHQSPPTPSPSSSPLITVKQEVGSLPLLLEM